MTNVPLLSVCLITYNHENYIRQAIEGVLMQKVNFNWELIIAEDCSTDKTRDIILEYKKKHPDFIKLILQEKNVGPAKNWIELITKPNSKYIAYFEGDDYWTDPLKLQKQVGFLEANPDYVIHSGFAKLSNEKNELLGRVSDKGFFDLKDFYTQNNLVTCTVMFRNLIKEYPKLLYKIRFGDWFLYVMLLNISKLKAYTSDEVFSFYRLHDQGTMVNLSKIDYFKVHMLQIKYLKEYLGFTLSDKKDIDNINNYSMKIFEIEMSNKYFLKALKTVFLNFNYVGFKTPFRFYFKYISKKIRNKIVVFFK